jgi:hypothetical protein
VQITGTSGDALVGADRSIAQHTAAYREHSMPLSSQSA